MTEKATYFSEREHQICAVAHMVEDAKTYWVTGGGSPMAAILPAKKLYAPPTAVGDYEGGHRRFGGPGGADSIAALCWRTILLTDQQKRKFVPRVDFISSPGFLDGSLPAPADTGLPRR